MGGDSWAPFSNEDLNAGNARCWCLPNLCQLHVPRPNNSELWQRLRAARELAHKSHQDIADAVGLSEVTVSTWESPDQATRTQPTAQQVMRVAKLCRLPLYLLVDDAVSVQDIESFDGL